MSPVLSLLNEMRSRLGMFIGVPSIIRLAAFLRGYDLAVERFSGIRDPFLPAFWPWIQERFGNDKHSWEDLILLHSANDADAVKRFWELLDEFVKKQALPSVESLDTNGIDSAVKTLSQDVKSEPRSNEPHP